MAVRLDHGDEMLVETHEINVTPFIDVILVLLIIFMVAAPLATVDVPVELPSSTAQSTPRPEEPVFLTVTAERRFALGNDTVERDRLDAALAAATGGDQQARIFIRADKGLPYGELMEVFDLLRAAGYQRIGLVGLEGR